MNENDILADVHRLPAAVIRGVWCEASSAIHSHDDEGALTVVALTVSDDDGEPMGELLIDGHIDRLALHSILASLGRGITPYGVWPRWVNGLGLVA